MKRRKVVNKYISKEIDYSSIAKQIYKHLKENETYGNEIKTTKDNELYGMQGVVY